MQKWGASALRGLLPCGPVTSAPSGATGPQATRPVAGEGSEILGVIVTASCVQRATGFRNGSQGSFFRDKPTLNKGKESLGQPWCCGHIPWGGASPCPLARKTEKL
jgi:hypothetical protein